MDRKGPQVRENEPDWTVNTNTQDRDFQPLSSPAFAFTQTDAIGRIPCLDGLRGVASLMVMLYHFGPHIAAPSGPFHLLHALPDFFFAGVDLFFVLSGFLIGGILLDVRESPRYFTTFYIRRVFRIFPLYYVTLLSYEVALWVAGDQATGLGRLFQNPIPRWTFWCYLQNLTMTTYNTFGPIWLAGSWSLAIEEQFYLLLPPLVRRVSPRTLYWVCWAAVGTAFVLRGAISKSGFLPPLGAYVLLPVRMDALAAGVLVAYAFRYRRDWIDRWQLWWPRLALGLGILWIAYPYVPNPHAIRLAFIHHTGNAIVFALILLALVLFPQSRVAQFLSRGWMRKLGDLAYSTYLFHPIVLGVVFWAWTGADPVLAAATDLVPLTAAMILTLLITLSSWHYLEKPLLKIGHRFVY